MELANTIGRENYPRVRLQSSVALTRGPWGAVVSHRYTGRYGDLNRGSGVEVASYGVGISSLDASLSRLKASDPSKPEVECTWEPLVEAGAPRLRPVVPEGLADRARLLLKRLVRGAAQP